MMNTAHTYILRQKKIIQNGNVFVILFLSMRNGEKNERDRKAGEGVV